MFWAARGGRGRSGGVVGGVLQPSSIHSGRVHGARCGAGLGRSAVIEPRSAAIAPPLTCGARRHGAQQEGGCGIAVGCGQLAAPARRAARSCRIILVRREWVDGASGAPGSPCPARPAGRSRRGQLRSAAGERQGALIGGDGSPMHHFRLENVDVDDIARDRCLLSAAHLESHRGRRIEVASRAARGSRGSPASVIVMCSDALKRSPRAGSRC
jgi:hypothetical protein